MALSAVSPSTPASSRCRRADDWSVGIASIKVLSSAGSLCSGEVATQVSYEWIRGVEAVCGERKLQCSIAAAAATPSKAVIEAFNVAWDAFIRRPQAPRTPQMLLGRAFSTLAHDEAAPDWAVCF